MLSIVYQVHVWYISSILWRLSQIIWKIIGRIFAQKINKFWYEISSKSIQYKVGEVNSIIWESPFQISMKDLSYLAVVYIWITLDILQQNTLNNFIYMIKFEFLNWQQQHKLFPVRLKSIKATSNIQNLNKKISPTNQGFELLFEDYSHLFS